jgi:tetratricopeptide (TPR) repeat protein
MDLQHHLLTLEADLKRLTVRLTAEAPSANAYVQRGMMQFKLGRIAASIADFDRAEQLHPALTPYLWQRGLSYYYATRFADGARQFEVDLQVNGQDVEETIWRYLCQAQLQGAEVAREGLLAVRNDPRPVMATVYALFAGDCDAAALLTMARDRREHFYSQLYAGLYYEAERDVARARYHITQAATMQIFDDYMGWLAIVHQQQRGWDRDQS